MTHWIALPRQRGYTAIAGWVPEPNNPAIPTELGKAFVASDAAR
jgi:hypothetical protein